MQVKVILVGIMAGVLIAGCNNSSEPAPVSNADSTVHTLDHTKNNMPTDTTATKDTVTSKAVH